MSKKSTARETRLKKLVNELNKLTPAQMQDCAARNMLRCPLKYLREIKESKQADAKMSEIDLRIAQLTPEQQLKRQSSIDGQRSKLVMEIGSLEWTLEFQRAAEGSSEGL